MKKRRLVDNPIAWMLIVIASIVIELLDPLCLML